MSTVDNQDDMERLVHQAFHDIADKLSVDVDLVARIVQEYSEIMGERLDKKLVISEN